LKIVSGHTREVFAAELPRDKVTYLHDLLKVDAVVDSEQLAEIQDVLSGHIAGRALSVRASPDAGNRGVRHADPLTEGHNQVWNGTIIRVMEVGGQDIAWQLHSVDECVAEVGSANPDRVTE